VFTTSEKLSFQTNKLREESERLEMDSNNGKIITLAFVAFGGLAAFVSSTLMTVLADSWGVFARLYAMDAVKHGIPVAVGFLLFLFLQFNTKTQRWADEAVIEVRKVVWPSQKDTVGMTIVVCVMVIVAGIILGLFDFMSTSLVGAIIQ